MINSDRYWACRRDGGLHLCQDRFVLRFTGADRIRYLNGQTTNDIRRLEPGRSMAAAVLSAKGRLMGDVVLAVDGDSVLVDGPASVREELCARLERYIVADDVVLEPLPDGWRLAHAWGTAIGGVTGWNSRHDRLGFDGVDFLVPPGTEVAESCDESCAEIFRIEAGLPRWGAELDERTLPPEAGDEDRWIRYDKGCYLGQEIIARIKSIGHVNRRMVGLSLMDGGAIAVGAEISAAGQGIGKVTSAGFSPQFEKGVALGYVHRQHAEPGQSIAIGGVPGQVVRLPMNQS